MAVTTAAATAAAAVIRRDNTIDGRSDHKSRDEAERRASECELSCFVIATRLRRLPVKKGHARILRGKIDRKCF